MITTSSWHSTNSSSSSGVVMTCFGFLQNSQALPHSFNHSFIHSVFDPLYSQTLFQLEEEIHLRRDGATADESPQNFTVWLDLKVNLEFRFFRVFPEHTCSVTFVWVLVKPPPLPASPRSHFPLKPWGKATTLVILPASHAVPTSSPFSRIRLHTTVPAVRVSSIRPKANYLSGAPHFCSPCCFFFPFLILFSFPPFLCMSQIKVCTSALAAHRGSEAWNKFNILHWQIHVDPAAWCRKNLLHSSVSSRRGRGRNTVFYQRTQMVIWTFVQPFFFYRDPFFRKLICTKTSMRPSSGLKATLVGHQGWFSTSDNFFRGEMAWNWILWQHAVLLNQPWATQYLNAPLPHCYHFQKDPHSRDAATNPKRRRLRRCHLWKCRDNITALMLLL